MEKTKFLGLPKKQGIALRGECQNALLDTRSADGTLSPWRAAKLLKQRVLGGVHVRLSFSVAPDPLSGEVLFDEEDLWELSGASWNHLIGYQMQQAMQRMKVDLETPVDADEDALESLRDKAYAEVIAFTVREGGKLFKFVGDATLSELTLAAEQYREKRERAGKRERRCDRIIEQMEVRGAASNTTVSEALNLPFNRAV